MGRPRKHDTGLPAYVRIVNGSYHYRGRKLCRVDEGESRMYEALAERKALPSSVMVPAAVANFKRDPTFTKLTPGVRKEHARLLGIFAADFADWRVDQVEATDLKRNIKHHYPDHPAAASHYKSRLSTFFRWCITDEGLIKINPCGSIQLQKPRARKTPWTPALFWAVRDKLLPMYQCYHDLSYLLYQRTTDVRRLRLEQLRDDIIRFEPSKTLRSSGVAVDIPITPAIREVLNRAAALRKEIAKKKGSIGPFVIVSRTNTAFTRSGINSAYRRADESLHGKEAMAHLNPKALRPFAATEAKRLGATMEQLKDGLAHTTIATTEGYIQAHEVPVSEVIMRLPDRPKAP